MSDPVEAARKFAGRFGGRNCECPLGSPDPVCSWCREVTAKLTDLLRSATEVARLKDHGGHLGCEAANDALAAAEAEVERLRAENEHLRYSLSVTRGGRERIEEAAARNLERAEAAERKAELLWLSQDNLDRMFQQVFPDWASVTPPEGVPLRLYLLRRLRAENEALRTR
jgi:hypothetical protein